MVNSRSKPPFQALPETQTELARTPIFQNCTPAQRTELSRIVIPKSFAHGEMVMRQGEVSRGFFVLRTGAVHVHRLDVQGHEQLIRVFHAPESFAEASLFPHGMYPASGRALGGVDLWMVPKPAFSSLLASNPQLAVAVIGGLSQRIHALVGQWQMFRFGSARDRIFQWLLLRDHRHPGSTGFSVVLPDTKSAWAEELGIRQETLSRLLCKLRKTGVLEVHGREIFVPNRRKLENPS